MHCPFCSFEDTKVIDSRLAGEGRQVRRRRECLSCGERFTTRERSESARIQVLKRDGSRQEFDRRPDFPGLFQTSLTRRGFRVGLMMNVPLQSSQPAQRGAR